MTLSTSRMERIVGQKYKFKHKLGNGSFGEVFLATNLQTGKDCAVKMELSNTRYPLLKYESKIYDFLAGGIGIPNIQTFGSELDYSFLAMDLLGPTLERFFDYCERRFSMKTILMLADQMLTRIMYLHDRGFIYRDVKPDNFLVGVGQHCSTVFVVDFGLAKKYREGPYGVHIPYKEGINFIGTARYSSINAHRGIEQSRRDDLEAMGYVLMYFARGNLPWQGLKAATKQQKYYLIGESKYLTPIDFLCEGYPIEFATYLNYCRNLRFAETPDYAYLQELFRNLFFASGYARDNIFDWSIRKQ